MSVTRTGALHAIVQWVRENGELKAVDRLKVFSLSALLKEGIKDLDTVEPSTACSEDSLTYIRDAAKLVVGTSCPH